MTNRVEFGVRLPVAGPLADPQNIRRVAVAAEELGFEAVWVHDYIVWTKDQDKTHVSCGAAEVVTDDTEPRFFESLTSLAYVAGITDRIKLGVAVLCLPFRNPIVTAKQVANVDVLSGGRLILGVGVGGPRSTRNWDFEVLNVPRRDKYERAAEYLQVMKEVWTSRQPSFHGTYIQFEPTEIFPKPVQRPYPPLWFGGSRPKTMEMVARYGDGWLPVGITPERYPERTAELRELATAYGRPSTDFTIGTEIAVSIGKTSREAFDRSRRTFEVMVEGFARSSYGSLEAILNSSLVGSGPEVADKVQRFVQAGVTHFELKFVYPDIAVLIAQMEQFRDEVLEYFQHRVPA